MKVSEFLEQQLDQLAFTFPPQVQAGIDAAKALGIPVEIPDIQGLQAEVRERVLTSVTELKAKLPVTTEAVLQQISWLL